MVKCHDCEAPIPAEATACPLCKSMRHYWKQSDARREAMARWAIPLLWVIIILIVMVCIEAKMYGFITFPKDSKIADLGIFRFFR